MHWICMGSVIANGKTAVALYQEGILTRYIEVTRSKKLIDNLLIQKLNCPEFRVRASIPIYER